MFLQETEDVFRQETGNILCWATEDVFCWETSVVACWETEDMLLQETGDAARSDTGDVLWSGTGDILRLGIEGVEFSGIFDLCSEGTGYVGSVSVPVTIAVHVAEVDFQEDGEALGVGSLRHSGRWLQNGGVQLCWQHTTGTAQRSRT